jgi:chromosome segregation ATPase
MVYMKHRLITSLFVLASILTAGTAVAEGKGPRIKKCQDAAGQWHYGDNADAECARSKVLELDQRGIQRREIAAPLTEAELKARASQREEEEKQKKLADDQLRRDEILLATYAVEADITLTRDRKIGEIEAQIRATEETLKSLRNSLARVQAQAADEQRASKAVSPQTAKTLANNQTQIARHEAAIDNMHKEQEQMRVQYQADLERFRDLKNRAVAAPPAPKPAK